MSNFYPRSDYVPERLFMTARDYVHRSICCINIVQCDPYGAGSHGIYWPKWTILMPRYGPATGSWFTKQMRKQED